MSPVMFGDTSTKKRKKGKGSYLEERLAAYVMRSGLPAPVREFRFAPPRLWRFDFAWPDRLLAVEIEGGVFSRGGHTRGKDYTGDCEKYNVATLYGWTVLRFTVKHFERDGAVFSVLDAVLRGDVEQYRRMLAATVGTPDAQPPLGARRWEPPTTLR